MMVGNNDLPEEFLVPPQVDLPAIVRYQRRGQQRRRMLVGKRKTLTTR